MLLAALLSLFALGPAGLQAQEREVVELTLDRMVELTMANSFRIQQVNLGLQRTRFNLKAQQARLKSQVDLRLQAPSLQLQSDNQFDASLGRNIIVRENSQRWQADLSISQPVILFGYPTGGELSINSRVYQYKQVDGDGDVFNQYYNRYFMKYEHGLFQPNSLRNDLEQAQLSVESSELDFQGDVVGLINGVSYSYLGIFEDAYEGEITQLYITRLEDALTRAQALSNGEPDRASDVDQITIELANAREDLQSNRASFRRKALEIKQDLRMNPNDSLYLNPVIEVAPIDFDDDLAVQRARELTPRLRDLDINYRRDEIRLEEREGRGGFSMDLEFTYGREMRDAVWGDLFAEPEDSYSVSVGAYVPIWDWGARNAELESQKIGLMQTRLRIEEAEIEQASDVTNQITSLREYESRLTNMTNNLALAEASATQALERYSAGTIGALELVQSLDRERETRNNQLDAYLGWERGLINLRRSTYWDWEEDMHILDSFGIGMTDDFDVDFAYDLSLRR